MQRIALLVVIAALAVMPAGAAAQSLFDEFSFGLGPYFGLGRGASDCAQSNRSTPCFFYVGYSRDPGDSTSFEFRAENRGLNNLFYIGHDYAVHGLWLGASKTVAFSDSIGVTGSFWYLLPLKTGTSLQHYFTAGIGPNQRTWDTHTQWWYVDLLGTFGSLNGFSLLAGVRYDFFTTRFESPVDSSFPASRITDSADFKSSGYIPLIGAQMASAGSYGSLLFRVIGIPSLAGRLNYEETLQGYRIKSTGSYSAGHFVEAFAEYAYAVSGQAELGLFARFNSTHGTAGMSVDLLGAGGAVRGRDTFNHRVHRNDWSIGGRMSLGF